MSRSRPFSSRLTGSPVAIRSTSWPRRSSSSETAVANRVAGFVPARRTGKTWAIESGSGATDAEHKSPRETRDS